MNVSKRPGLVNETDFDPLPQRPPRRTVITEAQLLWEKNNRERLFKNQFPHVYRLCRVLKMDQDDIAANLKIERALGDAWVEECLEMMDITNRIWANNAPGSRIYTAFDSENPVDLPSKEEFERERKKQKDLKKRQNPTNPKGKMVRIQSPDSESGTGDSKSKGAAASKRKSNTGTEGESLEDSQPSPKKQHTDIEAVSYTHLTLPTKA